MAETKLDTDVIIIGAGSTGLLLAQGLLAASIPFRLFERHAADHTSREWSMSLHWGGSFLSTVLPPHLRERLDEINTDPEHDFSSEKGFVQCNGESGEVILVMEGAMPRRISRRKLRGLCREGVGVEYDKALTHITLNDAGADSDSATPSVTATFSDATKVTARILIGCDGSRSRTRQLLLGDDTLSSNAPTPYTILNFPYTYPARVVPSLRKIHPVFKVSYHPKLNCMYLTAVLDTSREKTTGELTFQNLLSWKGAPTAAEIKADPELGFRHFREMGAQFAEPYRVAAENVVEGTKLYADQGTQWDPRPHHSVTLDPETSRPTSTKWNNRSFAGTVTLAGDAAHAMLPHRGQGLNNGLEDAAKLVSALTGMLKNGGEGRLEEVIAVYEEEMVRRGGGEVEMTEKAAKAAHDWDLLMQSPIFKHGANKVR